MVAKLDAKLGELADVQDLEAQVRHTRTIAEKKRGDANRYIAGSFDRILEGLAGEAEKRRAAVQATAAALADAAEAYWGFAQRVDGLRASHPRYARLRSPACDAGNEIMKVAAGYRDGDLPLGTELR